MKQIEIINNKGEAIGNFPLGNSIWQTSFSSRNISLSNRYYLANQRKGNSKVKSRGEVAGSTRKIYRQKGTGNARHGDRYAPQFRGGGIAFGPNGKRNYSLDINKKEKKKSFQSLLGLKMKDKKIIVVDKINFDYYKTKEAANFINILPVKIKNALIILGKEEANKQEITRAFRNLPYIKISDSKMFNFLQVLSTDYVIFTYFAFVETEKRLS
ncbi:50S ribosomal protein L4 [endosymbiont GvMRE of Glomus versiforme]|uniref:50S ribosomal protein L4 n=1 Tax=endosymbiont GvMRE of Glomus versiforme TaxID=2039283 RepID=UPI000EDA5FEB|nr:50S ribosomal protein L4 [endosymbiont GvMRE of Glomus versiforme]RHZ35362.1 50S ribosomal protein L4 [endosymbiont GvMRE of Glomus versiforme]